MNALIYSHGIAINKQMKNTTPYLHFFTIFFIIADKYTNKIADNIMV